MTDKARWRDAKTLREEVAALRSENKRMRDALEQLDAYCACRPAWSDRNMQDPDCPAGDYGDIAREGLGLPPRCQANVRIAAIRNLKGGEE